MRNSAVIIVEDAMRDSVHGGFRDQGTSLLAPDQVK